MKQNKSNWRQSVSISNLPKMFVLGLVLTISSLSFSQTSGNVELPMARMQLDNNITVRTGLNETYKIPIGHFGFKSTQEATSYFQARAIDYVDFVVVDQNTVLMQFDLDNPAVLTWTITEWNQALANRASSVSPRTLSNN